MSAACPPIKAFLPSSLIEWEGRLSCAIFLPGCNFRCPFCHASDLVLHPNELDDVPLEAIIEHLRANHGWVDGAVISGGEATIHPGLPDLIARLREHVPGIKLDTNGSNPTVVEGLVATGLVDFVAMDVKAPLDERYCEAAGVPADCEAVQTTIELLRSRAIPHEFRTTVVPGIHTCRDIVELARCLGPTESLVLQQFAPLNCLDPALRERKPFSREHLRDMASAATEFIAHCRLRGEVLATGRSR